MDCVGQDIIRSLAGSLRQIINLDGGLSETHCPFPLDLYSLQGGLPWGTLNQQKHGCMTRLIYVEIRPKHFETYEITYM